MSTNPNINLKPWHNDIRNKINTNTKHNILSQNLRNGENREEAIYGGGGSPHAKGEGGGG
jgi:hypothetical protein